MFFALRIYKNRSNFATKHANQPGDLTMLRHLKRGLCKLIAGLAALFCAGTALAADLPDTKAPPAIAPPPAPVPAFSWTGLYVGVNGGYGFDHFSFPYYYGPPGGLEGGTNAINSGGVVLGGQVGYNYQLSNLPFIGHAVVGVEVDSDWADIGGSTSLATAFGPLSFGARFENFGTARGRVGYDFNRLLLYITGGLTYATSQASYVANGVGGSVTATRSGVFPNIGVAGAGAEYAITNNLSLRIEYLYDFSGARYELFSPTPTTIIEFGTRSMYHFARLGVDYKFDFFAPEPVVAKY
jgi:outer membrane immunogenic protein